MTQLRFIPATFAASAVMLLSSLSSAIVAPLPGCGDGPVCGVGFECTVVGGSSCASSPPCAAGEACPEPEPCVNVDIMGCTPAHCSADEQCAPGMVCHTRTEACPGTDCACASDTPDCSCGTSVCDPQTVSMCTPRYVLPCKAAADCGDGFTCEELVTGCASSGSSGGTPAPNARPAPIPPNGAGGAASDPIEPAPDCAPEPSGQFQCVPKQITCENAGECPAGWNCEQLDVAGAPPCAPGQACEQPAPQPTTAECRPPYYGVAGSDDLGAPVSSSGENPDKGTTGSGTAGSSATGGPVPEAANNDDASSHESSACQMGHAPASSGVLSLLTLLGALFGLKRRRAQGREAGSTSSKR